MLHEFSEFSIGIQISFNPVNVMKTVWINWFIKIPYLLMSLVSFQTQNN